MDRGEAAALFGQDILDGIKTEATLIGVDLNSDLQGVANYAASRVETLALAVGEPGYEEALIAERDNLALFAAGAAVDRADAIDARILAVTRGGLALAARGLLLFAGVPPV